MPKFQIMQHILVITDVEAPDKDSAIKKYHQTNITPTWNQDPPNTLEVNHEWEGFDSENVEEHE